MEKKVLGGLLGGLGEVGLSADGEAEIGDPEEDEDDDRDQDDELHQALAGLGGASQPRPGAG
jgi:hypothetical protein